MLLLMLGACWKSFLLILIKSCKERRLFCNPVINQRQGRNTKYKLYWMALTKRFSSKPANNEVYDTTFLQLHFKERNILSLGPIGIKLLVLELTMKHWTQAKYMILWVKTALSTICCWWCLELVEKVSCWFSSKAAENGDYSAIL